MSDRNKYSEEEEQKRLDREEDYQADQTNDNQSDPSAKRNIGLGGAQERDDQKDQLHNLVIEGNETTGYGDNDHKKAGEAHGGPGFQVEGGEFASPPIRNDDQVAD